MVYKTNIQVRAYDIFDAGNKIDVRHRRDDGGLVQQRHAWKALLSEEAVAASGVFGAMGEAFRDALHEPGQ